MCLVPLLTGRQVQSTPWPSDHTLSQPMHGQMGSERRLPGSLDASQKQNRLQHSKNLSSNIITAEFYINGNFQLSHSSVSMRGPGTGGISQRRTQQCCGRTGPPGMTPTTTWKGYTGSLHAKTSSQQRACLQQHRKMPCLSKNPTLHSSQWSFTKDRAETSNIICSEVQKATLQQLEI